MYHLTIKPDVEIRVLATAPYDPSRANEATGYIGIMQQRGALPERFDAATLDEMATLIAGRCDADPVATLQQLHSADKTGL
jgi:hypothetical protein